MGPITITGTILIKRIEIESQSQRGASCVVRRRWLMIVSFRYNIVYMSILPKIALFSVDYNIMCTVLSYL